MKVIVKNQLKLRKIKIFQVSTFLVIIFSPFFRIGFYPNSGNSSLQALSSNRRNSSLTLVTFNLEPLTDSLETLSLRGNLLESLPMQFRGRNFTRLRKLDLSHNDLQGNKAFKF